MLMDALIRLLTQKEFEDISIQEIADEATLNRATFYLHYPDKNALLQAMTAARFRDLIARRGLSFTDCDGALRAIALGVCDYLADTTGCPSQLTNQGAARGIHHPSCRRNLPGRCCQSWDDTSHRNGNAGDNRRVGHIWRRASLVRDPKPVTN
jgi:AcrR family transcriptional regulator